MKHFILAIFAGLTFCSTTAQTVKSLRDEQYYNDRDRIIILNMLKSNLYGDYKQDYNFILNVFNVCDDYAWVNVIAHTKDGDPMKLHPGDKCCKVQALFKKGKDYWYIIAIGKFNADDKWWDGLWDKTGAPRAIFK